MKNVIWLACGSFPPEEVYKIDTACYRKGEMQVVSGAMGKEKSFRASSAGVWRNEGVLKWLNKDTKLDMVLKSAIAHFWFIIIHPFDDGNGRIARAISDLLLTCSDESLQRFIAFQPDFKERKLYYKVLQRFSFLMAI